MAESHLGRTKEALFSLEILMDSDASLWNRRLPVPFLSLERWNHFLLVILKDSGLSTDLNRSWEGTAYRKFKGTLSGLLPTTDKMLVKRALLPRPQGDTY